MESQSHFSHRRQLLAGAGVGALFVASRGSANISHSPVTESQLLNVADFGAKGDGITDDAGAFRRAIDQGRKDKVSVWIPDGRYRLKQPLSIHAQGLIGNPWGSWVADAISLPILLPENMDSPALVTEMGGSIAGIEIRYPNDDPMNPIQRPAAIRLGETGATVRCVKISHPWIGIDTLAMHTNPGRTVVENVFINAPHKTGIHFTGAADVCLFRNVEVWTPTQSSGTFLSEGIGFHFQRGDGIRLTDCFVLGANRGFLFTESKVNGMLAGTFTGYLSNCLTDFCNTGMELRGDHRVSITGGGIWSHHSCIRLEEGQSTLLASSVEMFSNANTSLFVGSAKNVVIQGCCIERPHTDFSGPAVQISGGDQVSIHGNTVRGSNAAAILVNADRGCLLLQGNIVNGGIEYKSGSLVTKKIEGNLRREVAVQ